MSDTPKPSSFIKSSAAPAEQGRAVAVEGQVIDVKPKQKRKPTPRQIKAAKLTLENLGKETPKPTGEILLEAGYSKSVSETPAIVTESPVFQDLLDQFMPDDMLAETHKRLLTTRKIEHMVFPLYMDPDDELPEEGDLPEEYLEAQGHGGALKRKHKVTEGNALSDDDIVEMLQEVNCQVRKIVHGDQARHVYFWSHDAKAQQGALELAYKMRGLLGKGDSGGGDGKSPFNFNVFQGGQTFVKKGDQ